MELFGTSFEHVFFQRGTEPERNLYAPEERDMNRQKELVCQP